MDLRTLLRRIGLTDSEAKVYLALLEIGPTTKGPLVKKAKIASSKTYEIVNRLADKGLVTVFKRDKIINFAAAPPSSIRDYLDEKRQQIDEEETTFKQILPALLDLRKRTEAEVDAEVYRGWKGIKSVYVDIVETLKRGETNYVFGAGPVETRYERFFDWFNKRRHEKGIKIKIIFSEDSADDIPGTLNHPRYDEIRYLPQPTPSEIIIYSDRTIILVRAEKPLAIVIRGKEVADSFRSYFEVMWTMAHK
jgi:sugar-specific transcriptional regulator TrmB